MSQADASIAAVVVATDGRDWLPDLIDSLVNQTRALDDVIAVDNRSTDGSRVLLLERLGPDRILPSSQDLGFPAAANMGVAAVPDADYVLLLHDDVVLDPDTVEHLAAALDADARLAAVGPKIVDHDDPTRLLSMGMALDRFGQVHDHVVDQERDQGQGLVGSRHLAVTSAAMLVRRDVFARLGGFDQRFEMYRDDLDLCWRMWLAGWEVAVVPTTRVRHRRAGSGHHRDDRTAFVGPHYFRERNTLAAIVKNVTGLRVVLAVLGFLLAATVRAGWFVATRRFSEAWQTFQAWGWNVAQLPGTVRRRTIAQRSQRRTSAQIEHLFAGVGPQARHLGSVLGDRFLGSTDGAREPDPTDAAAPLHRRALGAVRRRPVHVTAVVLVVAGILVSIPVLLPGVLRLGEFQPFPASGRAAMGDYLAAWHDEGSVATTAAPSPAQAIVGLVQFLLLDNAWLASRALLLGLPLLAWALAQVALRDLVPTRGPRVVAATVYATSPPVLAAMRGGRLSVLMAAAMLPLFVASCMAMLRRTEQVAPGWRGAAGAVLAAGTMIAFNPVMVLVVSAALAAMAVRVSLRRDTSPRRTRAWLRLVAVAVGVPLVLFPWSVALLGDGVATPSDLLPLDAAASPMWQWLVMAPDQFGFPPTVVGVGFAIAGLLGIGLAAGHHPRAVMVLGLGAVVLVGLAGWLDGQGVDAPMWAGTALLLAMAPVAALLALGLRHARAVIAGHSFGWRQLSAGVSLVAVAVGVVGGAVDLARDGWALSHDQPQLPSFVTAEPGGDDHDVLVVALTEHGDLHWDLVSESGPTMASYGVPLGEFQRSAISTVLSDVVERSDPAAAGRLGLVNVGWVFVPPVGTTEELKGSFDRQFALRSETTDQGLVYRLVNVAPRVGGLGRQDMSRVTATGMLPADAEVTPVPEVRRGVWRATTGPDPAAIMVGGAEADQWRATAADGAAARRSDDGVAWFEVPADTTVTITAGDRRSRTAALVVQLVTLAFAVSVILRPPGTTASRRVGPSGGRSRDAEGRA